MTDFDISKLGRSLSNDFPPLDFLLIIFCDSLSLTQLTTELIKSSTKMMW